MNDEVFAHNSRLEFRANSEISVFFAYSDDCDTAGENSIMCSRFDFFAFHYRNAVNDGRTSIFSPAADGRAQRNGSVGTRGRHRRMAAAAAARREVFV